MRHCLATAPQYWRAASRHGSIRQPARHYSAGRLHTTQVTYAGHPLYYFVGDKVPGDTPGQDIDQFGAKWYVLAKDGKKIDSD